MSLGVLGWLLVIFPEDWWQGVVSETFYLWFFFTICNYNTTHKCLVQTTKIKNFITQHSLTMSESITAFFVLKHCLSLESLYRDRIINIAWYHDNGGVWETHRIFQCSQNWERVQRRGVVSTNLWRVALPNW